MKDLTKVGDLEVVERAKAKITADDPSATAIPNMVGREVNTVDELLLNDSTVVYQCMHPNDENCTYTAATVRSVTAHQRSHGDRTMVKKAQAELATVKAELDARIKRRSEGSKLAAQTRKATRAMAPSEIGTPGNDHKSIGNEDLAKAAQNVIVAFNAMQQCADEFQKVLIGFMRMAQTATDAPKIDPQIFAKAKAYDELKKKLFQA